MSKTCWMYSFSYDSSILAHINMKGEMNYKYGYGNYNKAGILQIANQILLYNEVEYNKFSSWVKKIERNLVIENLLE